MNKLLSKGCTGPTVRRVQEALNLRMLPPWNRVTQPPLARLVADGIFGTKTQAMVREFQRLNRLTDDGIVGPVTRLHLFPYVKFAANLKARGEFTEYAPGRSFQRVGQHGGPMLAFQTVADEQPKEPEKPQGFRFELFVGKGVEAKLKEPWPPKFGAAEQTTTVGAVLLRLPRLEISGELESSKALKPKRGDKWEWDGLVKASFEPVSPIGPITPFSPFIKITPTARLPFSVGIEAKIELLKDILELSIDGQGSFTYDVDKGKVIGGGSISGGLQFNLDIFFRSHPPSKP